jgi:hypothetical protein
MSVPFTYPDGPHERRHGPQGYANYENYRSWLRDEFAFRCVYCLTREAWGPFTGVYALDHFVPAILRPEWHSQYDNLFYSCVSCNLSKGSHLVPDPTTFLVAPEVQVTGDGMLHASTAEAARLIELVRLNRPRLREFRKLWIQIVQLAAVADPGLYRRLLGFPDDLPNLKRLRPPGGNTRPRGLAAAYHAQRQAGTLPATY